MSLINDEGTFIPHVSHPYVTNVVNSAEVRGQNVWPFATDCQINMSAKHRRDNYEAKSGRLAPDHVF